MRLAQALTPPKRVNHLRHSFTQEQGDQSPTQRGQFVPEFPGAGGPDQVNEEPHTQDEQGGVEFLHRRPGLATRSDRKPPAFAAVRPCNTATLLSL